MPAPRSRTASQPEVADSGRARGRPRILVVDDDRMLRELLVGALGDEGYDVQSARDGQEGLAALSRWRPDLVLLDLMMPVLDGWAFRSKQLESKELASIPVVVLSAGHNLRSGVDALQATVIFPKPFDLDALLAVVSRLVQA